MPQKVPEFFVNEAVLHFHCCSYSSLNICCSSLSETRPCMEISDPYGLIYIMKMPKDRKRKNKGRPLTGRRNQTFTLSLHSMVLWH